MLTCISIHTSNRLAPIEAVSIQLMSNMDKNMLTITFFISGLRLRNDVVIDDE